MQPLLLRSVIYATTLAPPTEQKFPVGALNEGKLGALCCIRQVVGSMMEQAGLARVGVAAFVSCFRLGHPRFWK